MLFFWLYENIFVVSIDCPNIFCITKTPTSLRVEASMPPGQYEHRSRSPLILPSFRPVDLAVVPRVKSDHESSVPNVWSWAIYRSLSIIWR